MKKFDPITLLVPIVTVLIMMAGILIYYNMASTIIEDEVTTSVSQTLKQAQMNLSYKLLECKALSDNLFLDPRMSKLISLDDDSEMIDVLTAFSDLQEMLLSVPLETQQAMDIRIYTRQSLIARNGVNFFSLESIENEEWYYETLNMGGGIYYRPTHLEQYAGSGDKFVISCARVLKNSYKYDDSDGVLLISINEEAFSSVIKDIVFDKNEATYIIDRDGMVISGSNQDLIGTYVLDDEEIRYVNTDNSGIYKVNDQKYIVFSTIELTGWKILTLIDRNSILENNTLFSGLYTTVMAVSAFLFIILIYNIVMSYTISQVRTREKKAVLTALQAQINPHFLYNALDVINWMAIKSGNEGISSMVNSLSKYFRLSLAKGKDVVTIKNELELARAYLEIQSMRFRHCIRYEFNIEAGIEEYMIPKLSLQPIVENAVLHGILNKADRTGLVTIRAWSDVNYVIIEVLDDGVGIRNTDIRDLTNPLSTGDGSGYGLKNVCQRIQLFNGKKNAMDIQSQPENGTTIRMRVIKRKNL